MTLVFEIQSCFSGAVGPHKRQRKQHDALNLRTAVYLAYVNISTTSADIVLQIDVQALILLTGKEEKSHLVEWHCLVEGQLDQLLQNSKCR